MPERLYNINHIVNTNNYQVFSDKINFSIYYPNNNAFVDIAGNDYLVFKNIYNDINIKVNLNNYSINNTFTINEKVNNLKIQLTSQDNIDLELLNNIIYINKNNDKIVNIFSSFLVDDIGSNAPNPQLSLEKNEEGWILSIAFDEDWLNDNIRVFPLEYMLNINFAILPMVSSLSVKALSSGGDQVYQDTRPDSATQFYISFYDDSEFRRLKANYKGMPVCSTVPYAVGDVYNLTTDEINQWIEGVGDESRNVYLQIIASRSLNTNQNITYDVILPGSVDYIGQQAEFVDTLDGLPVYRGVFPIYKNDAPSFIDGIGYLNVHLLESRYKALSSRINILRIGREDLVSTISTMRDALVKYDINSLNALVDVHELGRSTLNGKLTILSFQDVNSLKAQAKVVESLYSEGEWYNANLWSELREDSLVRKMAVDTTTVYPANFTKVTMNLTNGSALDSNGYVWSWGTALYAGHGSISEPDKNLAPIQLDPSYVFTDIEMGQSNSTFTIALNSSNEVWGWGVDTNGIFGLSSSSVLPVKISGAVSFRSIAAGSNFVVGTDGIGQVYWWGDVLNAGVNITTPTICPDLSLLIFHKVCAGDKFILGHNTTTGEVYKVGSFGAEVASAGVKISGVHFFTKVVAYSDHAIGLKVDGTVWGWGVNYNNCLGYNFPATNYTTDPIQIIEIVGLVTDISTGKYYSSFFNAGDIYVLGYSNNNYYKYSGLGNGANFRTENRTPADIVQKVRPISTWNSVFNGYSMSGAIDTNGKIYLYGEDSFTNYQNILRYNRNVPYQLRMADQDMWGGNASQSYTLPSTGYQVALPKLFTYLNRVEETNLTRFSMNATELVNSNSSYIAAKMNSASGTPGGTLTKWDYYRSFVVSSPEYRESSYFEYLYMMLRADSSKYSDFKQLSHHPYDKITPTSINYPFALNSTKCFYVTVNYIINNIPNPLTPFDSSYSLKLSDWSETFTSLGAKIGVNVDLYDDNLGKCFCNSIKVKNISKNSSLATFQFGIADFAPTPTSASGWNVPGNTYPIDVKILIQPDLNLYKISGFSDYSFVSPKSWIEITNIKINPYSA